MIWISHFDSCFDRKPDMVDFPDWNAFAAYLRLASTVQADKSEKERTPLISPAQYPEGKTRAKANVTAWDWVGLDVDGKTKGGVPRLGAPTFDDAVEALEGLGLDFVVYSTTSSTREMQCFRIVFPLSRTIAAAEHEALWFALNELFPGWIDPATKDVSRILTEPREWIGADNRFATGEGKPLDPDALIALHPIVAPPAPDFIVTAEMAAAFAAKAADSKVTRLTYDELSDLDACPIVPLAALTKALNSGQGGRMFSFLCSCALASMNKAITVDASDLMILGRALDMRMYVTTTRLDLDRDAARALRWAADRFIEKSTTKLATTMAAMRRHKI